MNLKKVIVIVFVVLAGFSVEAGNPDRSGQAGATELSINPWARSSGFFGMNISNVRGIEAMRTNVAGLAFIDQTQIAAARTQYLVGSDVGINAIGFAQKLGSNNAIGISLMTMDFGEIDITTTEIPEGGIGTYKPQFMNLGISFSRAFVDYIHGGVTVRIINESISDAKASGIALDAGIQYTSGPLEYPEQVKFGIALRNIGAPLRFSGDGLTFNGISQNGDFDQSLSQLSEKFELPTMLSIGGSYDFYFGTSRLTGLGSFTSNAFYKDYFALGAEYGMIVKGIEMFQLRAAYRYEAGLLSDAERTNVHTGLAAGFSFEYPLSAGGPSVGIDYAYRPSNPMSGSHTIGLVLNLRSAPSANLDAGSIN